jgi:hypothetical protein
MFEDENCLVAITDVQYVFFLRAMNRLDALNTLIVEVPFSIFNMYLY